MGQLGLCLWCIGHAFTMDELGFDPGPCFEAGGEETVV